MPPRVTAKSDFSLTRERRPNTHSHPPPSNAAEVRVTKTLLLVSTVFLVLNLPAHAIRCAQFIQVLHFTFRETIPQLKLLTVVQIPYIYITQERILSEN